MKITNTFLATLIALALAAPALAQNAPARAAQPQQGGTTAKINTRVTASNACRL